MKLFQTIVVVAAVLLLGSSQVDARRRKQKDRDDARKTKTKTKWSTTTDLGVSSANSIVATEEHGYYVKRTFLPANTTVRKLESPPYLGIPIAWFSCGDGVVCQRGNSGAINGQSNALNDGFLCDDDCIEPYQPICGKTPSEVAVFYNKCKLNVAKCRTHGLWIDLPYEECQKTYPKETKYTDKKFRSCPFFKDNSTQALEAAEPLKQENEEVVSQSQNPAAQIQMQEKVTANEQKQQPEKHLDASLSAVDEIGHMMKQVEQTMAQNKEKELGLKSESEKNKFKYLLTN